MITHASSAFSTADIPRDHRAGDGVLVFSDVYARFAGPVYRFCLSLVHDPHVAEDLCSDTFLSAMRAYERVQPNEGVLRAWLFRIARNVTIDHTRRASGGWRAALRLRREAENVTTVEATASLHEDLRRALTAAQKLKPRERQLVGLRTAAGLSFGEIGTIMGMSEEAARAATRRALERMRELMGASCR